MLHGKRMQTDGDGEHHMEVLHPGQNLLPPHLYPHLALLVLAFGAMAVAATVVAHMHLAAFGAHLDMAAEGSRPAQGH